MRRPVWTNRSAGYASGSAMAGSLPYRWSAALRYRCLSRCRGCGGWDSRCGNRQICLFFNTGIQSPSRRMNTSSSVIFRASVPWYLANERSFSLETHE